MTHAESQVVARIVFFAWAHREEELRAETGKLWVAAAITTTEVERYEQELRQHEQARIELDRYWQTKLIASEIERDDLRQRNATLSKIIQAISEAEVAAKTAMIGYRSVAEKLRARLNDPPLEILPAVAALRTAEHNAIYRGMQFADGNRAEAARLLGMNYSTIVARLRAAEELDCAIQAK